MSFCIKCGNELSNSINFCPQCGEKVLVTELENTENRPEKKKPKIVYATAIVFTLLGFLYLFTGLMKIYEGVTVSFIFIIFSIPFLYSSYNLFRNNPVKLKLWSIAFIVMGFGVFVSESLVKYLNENHHMMHSYIFPLLLSLLPALADKPYINYLASKKGE